MDARFGRGHLSISVRKSWTAHWQWQKNVSLLAWRTFTQEYMLKYSSWCSTKAIQIYDGPVWFHQAKALAFCVICCFCNMVNSTWVKLMAFYIGIGQCLLLALRGFPAVNCSEFIKSSKESHSKLRKHSSQQSNWRPNDHIPMKVLRISPCAGHLLWCLQLPPRQVLMVPRYQKIHSSPEPKKSSPKIGFLILTKRSLSPLQRYEKKSKLTTTPSPFYQTMSLWSSPRTLNQIIYNMVFPIHQLHWSLLNALEYRWTIPLRQFIYNPIFQSGYVFEPPTISW